VIGDLFYKMTSSSSPVLSASVKLEVGRAVEEEEDEGEVRSSSGEEEEEEGGILDEDDDDDDDDEDAEEGECKEDSKKKKKKVVVDPEEGEEVEEEECEDSLEEGEVSDDQGENRPPAVCRFFGKGLCTWGTSCRLECNKQGFWVGAKVLVVIVLLLLLGSSTRGR
jgi:hypothetical protein